MALKLPGAEDLGGPVSGRSGRPIASLDTSAIGRGVAQAGQGMRALSAGLKVREQTQKKQVDQSTAFDTQSRYLQFEDQQRKAFADSILKAPVGADGFTAGQKENYRKAAKEFFKTIPDDLKPEYNETLFKLESSITSKADAFAVEEKDRVAKAKIDDGQNVILQGLQDNPDGWKDADAQAEALVKNSGRSAIDQDITLRDWRKRRAEALWSIDERQNGPEARYKLGVAAPADVQGMAGAINSTAADLGVDPVVLATAISYETAGTFDPWKKGPTTKYGEHRGLIQWGEPQRRKYGVTQGMPVGDQMRAVGQYLRDAGVKPGMGLLDVYSAINAGRVGLYDRSDLKAGGAPGTVADKVAYQMEGHKRKAASLLGGQYTPELAPQYADMPYEDRVKLYDHSVVEEQQAANAAAVQLKAQQASFKDALSLGIETGTVVSQQEILSANIDDGDKATLLKALNTKLKEEGNASEAIAQFAAGTLTVDPFDDKGRKTVDAVYDRTLANTPAEQVQSVTEEMVRQTGVVPKAAVNALRGGIQSTDAGQVLAALQSAQRLSTVNPAAFGRRDGGGEIQKSVDDFTHYINDLNMDPTKAAQRIIEARDPSKQRDRKAIEPAAKEFLKSMQDFDLAGQFDDSFAGLSSDPSLGVTPAQELGIKADFLAIAEDQFYQSNGDPDLAQSRAVAEMKRLYGVTEFGGVKAVVKHPPERYWPKSQFQSGGREIGRDPSLDYAQKQLEADVTALDPSADLSSVRLITTPGTDAAVKRGELPGYAILYKDKDGMFQTVPGKLWRPDVTKAEEIQTGVDVAKKVLSETEAHKLHEQETQQLPFRQQGVDDFLSGNDPAFGARDDEPDEGAKPLGGGVPLGGQ